MQLNEQQLYEYMLKLQEVKAQLLKEAEAFEWQARFRRVRAMKIQDELEKARLFINPPDGAMVKIS